MIFRHLHRVKQQAVIFRLFCFLGCLAIVWLPLAIPLNWLLKSNPNLATIVTMGLLLVIFVVLQKWWGKYVYLEANVFTRYGLRFNQLTSIDLIKGLAIGFGVCWALFVIEAVLGWVEINNTFVGLSKIVAEGLLSALGIAFAEELVFRGWVLYELERDYSKNNALWISSIVFAIAHFLKPIAEIIRTIVTFPALLLLGLTLVWAKRSYKNNLAICIGIHGGLVWGYYILNVGNLIAYTDRVPDWITGIDGNPIAGLLGLSFLWLLALAMKKKQNTVNNQS